MKTQIKNISELAGLTFRINQPFFFKRYTELKYEDELIGRFQQKGFFGSSADIEILGQKWEIYKPSIWKQKIQIRKDGYDLPIAQYIGKFFKERGSIELPKGERLILTQPFFKKDVEIKTESGISLFSIKRKFSIKDNAEVKISAKSDILDKYPWLIFLGWFLILERHHNAADAGASS